MIKKYFWNKICLVEGLILLVPLLWFLFNRIKNQPFAQELTVNVTFFALLTTLFVFRSSHLRHMYFAFMFLVLLVIGNVFGLDNFAYLAGSWVLSLLFLGILNMFLFKPKD